MIEVFSKSKFFEKINNVKKEARPSTPLTKEWNNAIYTFNKNKAFKTLPSKDIFVYKLFNSYFNLKKIRSLKKKKFSIIKTYISKQEIKHNSNNVTITLCLFNKEKTLYKKHIYRVYKKILLSLKKSSKLKKDNRIKNNKQFGLLSKILKVLLKSSTRLIYSKICFNSLLLKYKNYYNLLTMYNIKKYRNLFLYKNKIILLIFSKYKYNIYSFLGLKNILNKIYSKKIELNLTNLKYIYLDSNILTEAIAKKLKNRKKNLLKNIIKAIALVKIPFILEHEYIFNKNKITFNDILLNRDLNKFLPNNGIDFKALMYIPSQKLSIALYNLKYKTINGIRIQASGRLTKRLTALRSISKFKQKGTLKNVYSSFYGMSTIMLIGYMKSNLQYIRKNYYNRNGSYGIKTHISSY
jgi:hypothetical protein